MPILTHEQKKRMLLFFVYKNVDQKDHRSFYPQLQTYGLAAIATKPYVCNLCMVISRLYTQQLEESCPHLEYILFFNRGERHRFDIGKFLRELFECFRAFVLGELVDLIREDKYGMPFSARNGDQITIIIGDADANVDDKYDKFGFRFPARKVPQNMF